MEQMRILSVNTGQAEPLQVGGEAQLTGINKRPARSSVHVSELGLADDAICDSDHHGGPDQAVYVYSANDYVWWSQALNREIPYGTFGDNLTIAEFPDDLNAGDRLLVGDLILEATAPRIPCRTLAAKMQDSSFGLRFREAERPGVYFRVLNAGDVAAGDPVTLVEMPGESVSMLEIFRAWYQLQPPPALLQRIMAAPVAERAQAKFSAQLKAAESAGLKDS